MSEMIKNSDVEDVLFSIRRLVSDTPEAEAKPEEASGDDAKTDALFLTSALRVNDPATEPEQVDLEDMTSDFSHFRDAVGRDDVDVAELPSLEEVFAAPKDEAPRRLHLSEVVEEEIAVEDNPAAPFDEFIEDIETGDLGARKWAEDPDVETLSDFATPDDTFGTPAEDKADDNVSDQELVAEDWMEDAAADAAGSAEDATDEASDDTSHAAEGDYVSEDHVEEHVEEIQADDTYSDAAETDDTHSEDSHSDDTHSNDGLSDDAKTDDSDSDEAHVEEIHAVDGTADEAQDQAADETSNEDLGAAEGLADFDENILDEDALRDMVTEIVREELSGELGERITRNVRKLVRREIHRALMTREFD